MKASLPRQLARLLSFAGAGTWLLCQSPNALAYVSYNRLGYVSCNACHFLPTGGGLLTPYGQSLGADLSALHQEKEPAEKRVSHGIHARALGIASESSGANPFLMQADYLAHAWISQAWHADLAAGLNLQPGERGQFVSVPGGKDAWTVRRALLSYQVSDSLQLQGGRDFSVAGLNVADHTSYVRSRARRNVLDYPTQLRAFLQNGRLQLLPYLSAPSFEENESSREYGVGLRSEYALGDTTSVGTTVFLGDSPALSRLSLGLFGRVSLNSWNGLLAEVDFISRKPHSADSGFGQAALYLKPYVAFPEWAEAGLVFEHLSVGDPFSEQSNKIGPSLNLRIHEWVSLLGDGRRISTQEQTLWSWYGQIFLHFQI